MLTRSQPSATRRRTVRLGTWWQQMPSGFFSDSDFPGSSQPSIGIRWVGGDHFGTFYKILRSTPVPDLWFPPKIYLLWWVVEFIFMQSLKGVDVHDCGHLRTWDSPESAVHEDLRGGGAWRASNPKIRFLWHSLWSLCPVSSRHLPQCLWRHAKPIQLMLCLVICYFGHNIQGDFFDWSRPEKF